MQIQYSKGVKPSLELLNFLKMKYGNDNIKLKSTFTSKGNMKRTKIVCTIGPASESKKFYSISKKRV